MLMKLPANEGNHTMKRYLEAYAGVFTPEQVKQMQEEMDRGETPGESAEARARRAEKIILRYQTTAHRDQA